MAKLTAEERADKLIRRGGEATEDVVRGIERMKETPGAAAKRAKERYRSAVLKALEDGTWDAGHESYSLPEFKERAIPKIRERYASGLTAARPKIVKAQEELIKLDETIARGLGGMPQDTDQQREARMLYNLRERKKFKLRRIRR